jgi:hypothetical protein
VTFSLKAAVKRAFHVIVTLGIICTFRENILFSFGFDVLINVAVQSIDIGFYICILAIDLFLVAIYLIVVNITIAITDIAVQRVAIRGIAI